ncbi:MULTISPECIES: I78 family peptidase inhibitor [unclassified Ruegeria]|uniref:I78 family peptidase inhibitor n=1 Tax=unclassified Ruegeria TaxID=2625375 RepID=UPI001488CAB6|nr:MULTISPECIES: I78 family peptidase inhibitor [unclassified Ruegeria]
MYRFFPILILLSACSETPSEQQSPRLPSRAPSIDLAFCLGDPFAGSIGQPVQTIQAALPERSRVLGPNDLMAQDYRIDRLNVFVDDDGIIENITCG